MNAILNIDYDILNKNNFINDIESICNESYSDIFVSVRLFFLRRKMKRIARKMEKLQNVFIKNIYKYEFNEVKEFQNKTFDVYSKIGGILDTCKNCDYHDECKYVFENNFYKPLTVSFEKTLKVIEDSFHINAAELTDEEFKEHNESLEEFADIWAYDTPTEDEKLVFEHNAKHHN